MGMPTTTPHGLPFIERARTRARHENHVRYRDLHARYTPKVQSFVTLPKNSDIVHSCPLSNLPFSGQCPIHACPGNKPGLEDGGCLYLFYGRTKLDKSDIMFSYRLNEKKLHDYVAHGQERIAHAVTFYKVLNSLRHDNVSPTCPHCGVGRSSTIRCDNIALCEDRLVFANHFIERSNLSYPEMQGRPSDVYLIAKDLKRFKKAAEATQTNMKELLGVEQSLLNTLSNKTSFV